MNLNSSFTTHELNHLEVTNLHKLLFIHWRLMKLEIMHVSSSTISGKSLRIHKLSVLLSFCYICEVRLIFDLPRIIMTQI